MKIGLTNQSSGLARLMRGRFGRKQSKEI